MRKQTIKKETDGWGCAFCNHPVGESLYVRDEGKFVTSGKTVFELGCLACRMKYGLLSQGQLRKVKSDR